MKKIYNKIYKILENFPLKLHLFKTKLAENIAIFNKRRLYKNVVWTHEQQKEFDNFWIKNYGKKISNRWHRLYQSINDKCDIRYFPEILFTTKFEPLFNPYNICKVLEDKSFVELLFNEVSENVIFPATYILCCSGIFYNKNRQIISEEEAVSTLKNIGDAVIKITVNSNSGKGVKMVSFDDNHIYTRGQILELFRKFGCNFIIQEKIKQHPLISSIYDRSINTFRVMTYVIDGIVFHFPIAMRIGGNGGVIDNIHAGGLGVYVSDEGYLNKYAYRLGYGDNNEKYERHPDSNMVFGEIKIPFIPMLIHNAYKLHGRIPHIGSVSWDFAVNDTGRIVLLEVNLLNQGSWFPQMVSGKGLFGENTEKILKKLARLK